MKTQTTDRWRYRRTQNAHPVTEDAGYPALAAAIVKQAVEDYRCADRYLGKKISNASWQTRYEHTAEYTKGEVVRFFKGQWYGILCDIDYHLILRKLGAE